jgi:Domain of unknown function (DUF1707)
VTAGPGDQRAAGRGRLRASHADREQVIDVLKVAYVQGRLALDELDERVGRTLGALTYDDLAAITGDIPWGVARPRPPRRPPAAAPAATLPPASAARWALAGLVPVSLMTATLLAGHGFIGGELWLFAAVSVMVWVLAGLLILRLRISEQIARIAPGSRGPGGHGPGGHGLGGHRPGGHRPGGHGPGGDGRGGRERPGRRPAEPARPGGGPGPGRDAAA